MPGSTFIPQAALCQAAGASLDLFACQERLLERHLGQSRKQQLHTLLVFLGVVVKTKTKKAFHIVKTPVPTGFNTASESSCLTCFSKNGSTCLHAKMPQCTPEARKQACKTPNLLPLLLRVTGLRGKTFQALLLPLGCAHNCPPSD